MRTIDFLGLTRVESRSVWRYRAQKAFNRLLGKGLR
jgi:hypothetical protein